MVDVEAQGAIAEMALRMAYGAGCEVVAIVPVRQGSHGSPLAVGIGRPRHVDATPQAILRAALMSDADSLVLLHTHPQGGPPSEADMAVTRRVVAAGALVGVPLLSHLVIAPTAWYDCCKDRPDEPSRYSIPPRKRGTPLDAD